MPVSLLLSHFLSQSAVKLGRFVTSVDEPHQRYYDPKDSPSFKVVEKVESHYNSIDSLTNHRTFASELTSLLSATFLKRYKTSIQITTNQVKTYYLDNYGEWFMNAVQPEDVRRWLERAVDEGEDIYFVVGYHTTIDARVVAHTGQQLVLGGKLVMPISAALAPTGAVVPIGMLADPGLASSGGRMEDQQRQFVAQGEQIIAVQYRKVCFRWFSSKTADKAMLAKKTQWERYDRPRYLHGDGEDRVEVGLEDNLALEGDREKYTTESGEILFSAPGLDGEEE